MRSVNLATVNGNNGWFPPEVNLGELEKLVQESFATIGRMVVHEYFIQGAELAPKDISFLVLGHETSTGQLASGLIAREYEFQGIRFMCYDKIFVAPEKMGNGLAGDMISAAMDEGKKRGIPVGVLRTSSERNDGIYGRYSDIDSLKIGDYFMHGFGFLDKSSGIELYDGAKSIFPMLARHVAEKPQTTIPIPKVAANNGIATAYA